MLSFKPFRLLRCINAIFQSLVLQIYLIKLEDSVTPKPTIGSTIKILLSGHL